MIDMFLYNWQIREEWFKWCETISNEELTKKRIGGMGSIIHNLFHVIDCEQIWVNQMKGEPVVTKDINSIATLNDIKRFSNLTMRITQSLIESLTPEHIGQLSVWSREIGLKPISSDLIVREYS